MILGYGLANGRADHRPRALAWYHRARKSTGAGERGRGWALWSTPGLPSRGSCPGTEPGPGTRPLWRPRRGSRRPSTVTRVCQRPRLNPGGAAWVKGLVPGTRPCPGRGRRTPGSTPRLLPVGRRGPWYLAARGLVVVSGWRVGEAHPRMPGGAWRPRRAPTGQVGVARALGLRPVCLPRPPADLQGPRRSPGEVRGHCREPRAVSMSPAPAFGSRKQATRSHRVRAAPRSPSCWRAPPGGRDLGAAMLERGWTGPGPFFLGKGRRERTWGKGAWASVVQHCHQAELAGHPASPWPWLPLEERPGSEVGSPGAGQKGPRVRPQVPGRVAGRLSTLVL